MTMREYRKNNGIDNEYMRVLINRAIACLIILLIILMTVIARKNSLSHYVDDNEHIITVYYNVEYGDTITSIAEDTIHSYGHMSDVPVKAEVKAIVKKNNFGNPDKIKAGQMIKIPVIAGVGTN